MKELFNVLNNSIETYLAENKNMIAPSATHALICANQKSPILIVTTSTYAATKLAEEIQSLVGSNKVVSFPAWETLPHERLSPKPDTITERFKALNKIINEAVI